MDNATHFKAVLTLVAHEAETLIACLQSLETSLCSEYGNKCARYGDAAWTLAAIRDECLVKIMLNPAQPMGAAPSHISFQHYSALISIECARPRMLISIADKITRIKVGQPGCKGAGLTLTS